MYRCVMNIPDDPDQKWRRIVGGINSSKFRPPLPIYFHDVEYRQERHAWVQDQIRRDDEERLKLLKNFTKANTVNN